MMVPAGGEPPCLLHIRRRSSATRSGWSATRAVRSSSSPGRLGIAESGLRRWLRQHDVDRGAREGLSSDVKAELVALRRENRVLKMERDLLSRAAAFFANENVNPPRR